LGAWIAACSGKQKNDFDCTSGTLDCSCRADDGCDDGLVCNARHLCVTHGASDAGGTSGVSGQAGGASSRAGRGNTGTGATDGGENTGATGAGEAGAAGEPMNGAGGSSGRGGAMNGAGGARAGRGGGSALGGRGGVAGLAGSAETGGVAETAGNGGSAAGAAGNGGVSGAAGNGGVSGAGGTAGNGGFGAVSGAGGTAGSGGFGAVSGAGGQVGAGGLAGSGGTSGAGGVGGVYGSGGLGGLSGRGGASGKGGRAGGGGSGGNCTEITLPSGMTLRDLTQAPSAVDYEYRINALGNSSPDYFFADFYGPRAGYDGDAKGSFTLGTGVDANFSSCGRCMLAEQDDGSAQQALFFASSGTIDVASASDQLNGFPQVTLTNVTLVEVTIDNRTNISTPVPGGRCLHLASGSLSFPSGWTCATQNYAAADGCDCGCGVEDGDCASVASDSCDFCHCPGDTLNCKTTSVRTTNNALCQ
jgi:hypothetical protein